MNGDTIGLPAPDWVMCGVQHADGVRVIASRDLDQAELRAEMQHPDITDTGLLGPFPKPRYFLTAEMRQFTVVDAPDYPTAFASLFRSWQPGPAGRTPVTEGPRQIGAG